MEEYPLREKAARRRPVRKPRNCLHGEQVPCAGVGGRVPQLRHRPGLDLADPLPGEVEVLANLFEGTGLASVETEAQRQDLPLPLVERGEELLDLGGE